MTTEEAICVEDKGAQGRAFASSFKCFFLLRHSKRVAGEAKERGRRKGVPLLFVKNTEREVPCFKPGSTSQSPFLEFFSRLLSRLLSTLGINYSRFVSSCANVSRFQEQSTTTPPLEKDIHTIPSLKHTCSTPSLIITP